MAYKDDIQKVASLNLPWEELRGSNILITGATGLIGSCLVEVLMSRKNKDYNVYASGRNELRAKSKFKDYVNDPTFHFLKFDVTETLKSNINFKFIIHAACDASPNFYAKQPVEVIKANMLGVMNLMDYGLEHGLKRFLFVSSGEVYGEGDGRVFIENYSGYVDCTKPRSCYPTSKRAAESLCVSYAQEYGIETVIARPCHIYGPGFTESDNRVFAQFVRNVLHHEDIVMKSTGSQLRSWCYCPDCASGILHVLLKGENGAAYNIADESSNVSIKELAELIACIGGRKVVVSIPDDSERAGCSIVAKAVFSTEKLEKLGWKTMGTLKANFENTIHFLQREFHQQV